MTGQESTERATLRRSLDNQRNHVLGSLEALPEEALRRPVLPTGWTCLGLVQHLTFDVEQFWFARAVGGLSIDPAESGPDDAWQVAPDVPAQAVFDAYRREIARADTVIATAGLDEAPAHWPDIFPRFLADVRGVVLHVITETACHAGHLDAARELIDGKTWLILTG
jgi:uncharacterized damage-inducible protein DinB